MIFLPIKATTGFKITLLIFTHDLIKWNSDREDLEETEAWLGQVNRRQSSGPQLYSTRFLERRRAGKRSARRSQSLTRLMFLLTMRTRNPEKEAEDMLSPLLFQIRVSAVIVGYKHKILWGFVKTWLKEDLAWKVHLLVMINNTVFKIMFLIIYPLIAMVPPKKRVSATWNIWS